MDALQTAALPSRDFHLTQTTSPLYTHPFSGSSDVLVHTLFRFLVPVGSDHVGPEPIGPLFRSHLADTFPHLCRAFARGSRSAVPVILPAGQRPDLPEHRAEEPTEAALW